MFHPHISKRTGYIAGSIALALFAAYALFRLLPPSSRQIEEAAARIEQQSYYQLEVNGRPAVYFANHAGSVFSGGATNKDSIRTRQTDLAGYWINRYRLVPSSFGRIVAQWKNRPSTVVNMNNRQLHQLVLREFIRTDHQLAGLQTQYNELSYYLRVHSIQDYGYIKIADRHAAISHQMDSLRKIMHALHDIPHDARLRVRQMNRYTVVLHKSGKRIACNRLETDSHGFILLQTANRITPLNVHTRLVRSDAEQSLIKAKIIKPKPVFLPKNAITDSTGYYTGETRNGKPHGYGQHYGYNGSYYDGHWADGQRDGFGFFIAPYAYLQVGEWRKGVYKGERLTYNADRIYGIDLSKHQHEIKKKIYPIHWNRLRITDLGSQSPKKTKGRVDYPISFAYIKSTEGCTVLNSYYSDDYRAARAHGIRVGTYHFFSTTSPGAAQAAYFLKCSHFGKGDLPPVLDVEPSDAQIVKMGGAEVMFRHIRDWLKVVQKHTGKRPILYISQMFTKQYMPLAPDLGDNYPVWIARYGEYKPDMKLVYWQLCPDGRVRGIHGEVDINIFNGYRNQYEEFLKRHCF